MKNFLVILLLISNLFALEGMAIKSLLKIFSKDSIEMVAKKYGDDGTVALEKLSMKYGKNGINKLEEIETKYGKDGVKLVAKYGDEVVKNRATFNIVKKFGYKGYYLINRFPKRAVEYYNKFGDKFVILSDKFGNDRVIKYLDGAKKYNADNKIIKFLDKFGEKANNILDRHWGKLLASGFVLLNSDNFFKTLNNLGEKTIDKAGETVVKTTDSNFGILAGIALILFIFLKYGWDFIVKIRKNNRK
jgi:hypothetical protein